MCLKVDLRVVIGEPSRGLVYQLTAGTVVLVEFVETIWESLLSELLGRQDSHQVVVVEDWTELRSDLLTNKIKIFDEFLG